MRRARSCYDHIAGRLGVAIAERLQQDGAVTFDGESGRLGDAAEAALGALGIALDTTTPAHSKTPVRHRPFCRPCLDWSERRPHIAGTLGALICVHCLEQRWLVRRAGGRAFDITVPGESALRGWLGGARWQRVMAGYQELAAH